VRDKPARIAVVAAHLSLFWTALIVAGAWGGALGWRPGGFIMLAAVLGIVAGHRSDPRRLRDPYGPPKAGWF
jgi:hypothetical protein